MSRLIVGQRVEERRGKNRRGGNRRVWQRPTSRHNRIWRPGLQSKKFKIKIKLATPASLGPRANSTTPVPRVICHPFVTNSLPTNQSPPALLWQLTSAYSLQLEWGICASGYLTASHSHPLSFVTLSTPWIWPSQLFP